MITSSYAPISYPTNGATTAFTVPFPFQLPTDLVVTLTNIATGAVTTLNLGSAYGVSGGGSPASTGTVTTVATYATGSTLTIARALPFTQLTEWAENDAYPANSERVENALDKLTMLFQQTFAGIIPTGQLGTGTADASKFLRGDATWNNVLIGAQGAAAAAADSISVMTVEQNAAAAFRVTSGVAQQASYYFAQGGSANPFEMRLTYDPSLAATGFAGTGAMHQLFYANGDVDWSGFHYDFASGFVGIGTASPAFTLDVVGNVNITGQYTGNAAGSLITSGRVLPQFLGTGTPSSLNFLRGDGTWQVVSGGGGSATTTTTGTFTVAAVSSSQTVSVVSTSGLPIGTYIYVSDGTHTIIGQITAIASLDLTVKTAQIVAGSAGNTMASGAAVSVNSVPGSNSLLVSDGTVAQTPVTALTFAGNATSAIGQTPVHLYLSSTTGSNGTVEGYFSSVRFSNITQNTTGSGWSVLGFNSSSLVGQRFRPFVASAVLKNAADFSSLDWGLIDNTNITAASLTPALLNVTNALTDTYLFGYDSGSGHFKMFAPTGVPSGGNDSQFLRGDGTFSNFVNMVDGQGGFVWGAAETTNAYGVFLGLVGSVVSPPTGFNTYLDLVPVKKGVSSWNTGGKCVFNFAGPLAVTMVSSHAVYSSIDSANVEIAQFSTLHANFVSNIVRADGFRSGAGYWQYAYTVDAPGSSLTVDLKNGSYQRHTGLVNNVTVTLTDSTPAPTDVNFQYANELTLEINAPGSYTYTWPGSVTWANGQSAPTLSTTGINLLRFKRRQGQTQWIGSVENPATSGYTNAQAQDAVGGILSNAGTIQFAYTSHTSITGTVPTGGITSAMLAGNVAINKLASYPSNGSLFLAGDGTWKAGLSFSPALSYTWTAAQAFNANNTFGGNNTFTGSGTYGSAGNNAAVQTLTFAGLGASSFGVVTVGQNDASTYWHGIDINVNNLSGLDSSGTGGMVPLTMTHIASAGTKTGANVSIFSTLVNATPTVIGKFSVNQVLFTNCTKIAGGTSDATFLTTQTPNNAYTGSNDPFYPSVGHHSFTGGTFRVGEINYGNTWGEFDLQEYGGIGYFVAGWECYPQVAIEYPTFYQYDAQWAIHIGNSGITAPAAGPGQGSARNACNYIGLLVDKDAISPGGYALRLWGAVSALFNGANAATNAPASMIKMSGTMHTGIDFTGYNTGITGADSTPATIIAESVTGHSNQPAIQLAQGQAICLKMPTGANTGTYLVDDGTHLRATRDGGNTWTNII